jgi:VWFA-related protein
MRAPVVVTAAVLLASVIAGDAQEPAQQRPPTFRAGANYVYVDAYVRRDGRNLDGLSAGDFDVLEDGRLQKIETFEFIRVEPAPADEARTDPTTKAEGDRLAADPRNRVFVVYLDTFHTSPEGAKRSGPVLREFLQRYMSPTDLFGVLTPLTPVPDLVFGRRLESAESMLAQYWNWARDDTPRLIAEERFLEQCYILRTGDPDKNAEIVRRLIDSWRMDRVLTGLEQTIAQLGRLRDERKNLLLVSDGWIARPQARDLERYAWGAMPQLGIQRGRLTTDTGQPNRQDHAKCDAELFRLAAIEFDRRQNRLADQANRANVSFFPIVSRISPWSTGMAAFDASAMGTLRRMAEDTDGAFAVNELRERLTTIGQDLSAFYLLGYYSTNTKADGRYRKIQVKVKAPGATWTARRGYLAPTDAPAPAGAAVPNDDPVAPTPGSVPVAAPTVAPGLTAALASLVRLASPPDIFTTGLVDADDLVIVAELPALKASTLPWRQGATVHAQVTSVAGGQTMRATGSIETGARGALLRARIEAGASGPWRVALQIESGGERLDEHVTVDPAVGGRLYGPAMMYRAAAAIRAPFFPVADRLFRRTERLRVEWSAREAAEDLEARLLTKAGRVVPAGVTLTQREVGGRFVVMVDLNLAPFGQGDYVIELRARHGTTTEESFVAFRVGP